MKSITRTPEINAASAFLENTVLTDDTSVLQRQTRSTSLSCTWLYILLHLFQREWRVRVRREKAGKKRGKKKRRSVITEFSRLSIRSPSSAPSGKQLSSQARPGVLNFLHLSVGHQHI